MKEKILSALKTKYSNLGFGDKAFTGVAEYLATTATDETDIDNLLTGVETLLKAFQGDIDSRVSSAVAKAKAESKGGDKAQPEKKTETSGDDNQLLSLLQEMKNDISTLKSERQQETLATKWSKAVSEKGIKNEKLAQKWMPKSEEEFEDSLNDLVEFHKTITIQEANENSTGKPASGSSSTGKISKETQSKLENWGKTKESPAKQD